MKKTALLVFSFLFITFSPDLFAQGIGGGIDISMSINGVGQSGVAEGSSNMSIGIDPFVVFRISELFEITPFISLYYHNEYDPNFLDASTDEEYSSLSLGGGFGLYFHFLRTELLDSGLGLRAEFTYYLIPWGSSAGVIPPDYCNILLYVDFPLFIDLNLSDNTVFLRLSINFFTIGLQFFTWSGVTTTVSSIGARLPNSIRAGLYFMF